MVACDFFTVETAWLKTLYVLFFIELGTIELGTRRAWGWVACAGCTAHPNREWITQQARQLAWTVQDEQLPIRFLIHDRDAKFTSSFNTVFESEGIEIILTPYTVPLTKGQCIRRTLGPYGTRRMLGPIVDPE